MNNSELKIAFFGGEPLSIPVLEELYKEGIIPTLIICNPDRPQGRGLELTPPPIKTWALKNNIATFQPNSLSEKGSLQTIISQDWDLFVVVAYSQIMPAWLIEIPKYKTINLHPSMLPKLRGTSPIRTSILEGMKDVGVTIIQLDEKMDHGPIIAQEPSPITSPIFGRKLDSLLAHQGGKLLTTTILKLINDEITPQEQNHAEATFSKKITKEMGELQLNPLNLPTGKDATDMYLKICAFDGWPGTFFFYNGKRIKILDATLVENTLDIITVIPEGKKEMDFSTFLKSLPNN